MRDAELISQGCPILGKILYFYEKDAVIGRRCGSIGQRLPQSICVLVQEVIRLVKDAVTNPMVRRTDVIRFYIINVHI